MMPILALRAFLLTVLAGVQGLSVIPAGDRTDVLIQTDGPVTIQHQMLASPPRIVVDLAGSEFALPGQRFMDINRGGVVALRSSQYQAGVVRVVVDLSEAVDYEIHEEDGHVRISFLNRAGPFEAWSTGAGAAAAATPAPAPPADAPTAALPTSRSAAPGSDARVAKPVAVTRPAVIEAPDPQQPRITVEFRNTPIVDVLGTFADFSSRSIVPGKGVGNQTITATIQDQPWDEAMRAILAGQGLAADEMSSGIIMVTSLQQRREVEQQEATVTEAFQLEYVAADSIAVQVQQLLGNGEKMAGTVAVNRATNSLIVSAGESTVARVRNLIPSLDKRTPQVTVQVRILSLRRSDFDGLGIHYEIKDTEGNQVNRLTPGWNDENGNGLVNDGEQVDPQTDIVSLTGSSIAAVGNAAERIQKPTFEVLSSLLLGRYAVITWLEAVERLELAELQADPVVTVLDNRTAKIHVGERTPIRVVDEGAASANGPRAQVRTEQTGVIIEVTPHVVADQVLLQLHAERSNIESFSADAGYVFGTSQTDTQILLNDGETAVISGLTTTDMKTTLQGIPILMDIPVLGALFRNTYKTAAKQDLLIMVTPYIDRSGGT